MTEQTTGAALAVADNRLPAARTITAGTPVAAFVPHSFDEAMKIARVIAQSGMAPKSYNNDEARILVGMMTGAEVGLTPMQSLRGVAVIGNQPSLWGDVALALVLGSGLLEDIHETTTGNFLDPNDRQRPGEAVCTIKRRGKPTPVSRTYSMDRARKAGLLTKSGPWQSDPERMCQMRARLFALRDTFADVLAGLNLADREEADEMTDVERATVQTIAATVTDLEEQARGEQQAENVTESAKAPAAEAKPKPARAPRQRVRQPDKADTVDERNPPPAEEQKADDAPAVSTNRADLPLATLNERMQRKTYAGMADDYATEAEKHRKAGDEEHALHCEQMAKNARNAVAELESKARFDDGVADVATDDGGYDLNRDDPAPAEPDEAALTLDEAVARLKGKELLADAQNYAPVLANDADKLMFEAERAKHVAGIREAAKRAR